jgi:hypothetical protein
MANPKRNADFVGKLWKIDNKYIFVDEVKRPKVRRGHCVKYNESDDGNREYYRTTDYVTNGCSRLCGKNEYNQYTSIELTPTRRKEAIETSWDEYLLAGIA